MACQCSFFYFSSSDKSPVFADSCPQVSFSCAHLILLLQFTGMSIAEMKSFYKSAGSKRIEGTVNARAVRQIVAARHIGENKCVLDTLYPIIWPLACKTVHISLARVARKAGH